MLQGLLLLILALAVMLFGGLLALLANILGLSEAAPYQLGPIMGFIVGFFKSSVTTNQKG